MTKVIVLGEQPTEKKKLKPIEFVLQVVENKLHPRIQEATLKPFNWVNIELISKMDLQTQLK